MSIQSLVSEQSLTKARTATFVMFLVVGLAVSSWAPMVPYAKTRLDLSDGDLGLVLLAFGIGALISMPLAGWLVHRLGSKTVTLVGMPVMICLIPVLPLAPTTFVLSLVLFLFGAASGLLNVALNAHAVTVETFWGRPIMSRFHCLFSLGGLLGAGAMSCLLKYGYTLFTCSASLAAVLFLLILTWSGKLLSSASNSQQSPQKKPLFAQQKIIFLGLVCFIFFLTEGSMLDWSAVFLLSTHDYDPALAGIGYAFFSVAMTVGRFLGDKLVQQIGPRNIVRIGSLLAASGLLICVNIPWGHAELLGFVLIGLGAANVVPVIFSTAGQMSQSHSIALATVTTMGYLGLLLGPVLIGFIAQSTSLPFAFTCLACLLLAVLPTARTWKKLTQSPAP